MLCPHCLHEVRNSETQLNTSTRLNRARDRLRHLRAEYRHLHFLASTWEELLIERTKEFDEFEVYHHQAVAALETALGPELLERMRRICPPSAYSWEWVVAGIQVLRARVAELEKASAPGVGARNG